MKIGDEIMVHGFVDEIRQDTVIIRNDGGYFGTAPSEVMPAIVRCKECKYKFMHGSVWECLYGLMIPSPDGFCSYGEREGE